MTRTELIARLRETRIHKTCDFDDQTKNLQNVNAAADMLEADAVNDDLTIAYMSGFKDGEDKYKAAARLTQQPLPDKQIEELAEWYGLEYMDYKPFARAIEQAHGIKGASL